MNEYMNIPPDIASVTPKLKMNSITMALIVLFAIRDPRPGNIISNLVVLRLLRMPKFFIS